jgi:hypothetical protein
MSGIVPQSASILHCPFLALPAPRIAGLLPARTGTLPPTDTVIPRKPYQSRLERQQAIWAAQDAEIEAFLEGARQRLAAVYAEVMNNRANRANRAATWEITA